MSQLAQTYGTDPAEVFFSGNMTWNPVGKLHTQLLICVFKHLLAETYEAASFQLPLQYVVTWEV